ncbi:MAG: hypothetical protein B6U73_01135 [Desulfurococcales archaeon ex4484_204]|nr:MAG: hypothetical protein B6U73_01135 [Desulfurococcales archaeon ex4484_204]
MKDLASLVGVLKGLALRAREDVRSNKALIRFVADALSKVYRAALQHGDSAAASSSLEIMKSLLRDVSDELGRDAELKPLLATLNIVLAESLASGGDLERSKKFLESAYSMIDSLPNPIKALSYIDLATIALKLGEPSRAKDLVSMARDEALSYRPASPQGFVERISVLTALVSLAVRAGIEGEALSIARTIVNEVTSYGDETPTKSIEDAAEAVALVKSIEGSGELADTLMRFVNEKRVLDYYLPVIEVFSREGILRREVAEGLLKTLAAYLDSIEVVGNDASAVFTVMNRYFYKAVIARVACRAGLTDLARDVSRAVLAEVSTLIRITPKDSVQDAYALVLPVAPQLPVIAEYLIKAGCRDVGEELLKKAMELAGRAVLEGPLATSLGREFIETHRYLTYVGVVRAASSASMKDLVNEALGRIDRDEYLALAIGQVLAENA